MKFQGNLFVLLLFLGSANSFCEEKIDLTTLRCDEPACDMVAERVEYKVGKPAHSITLRTRHFYVEVPDDPIGKIFASDGDLILYYRDGRQLIVGESSGPDIENLDHEIVNQFPEIIFLKTVKDVEPTRQTDLFFWKVALYQKPAFFNDATEVTYSENDGQRYFISNSSDMGFTGSAMITASNVKDTFLQVKAMKMDFSKFKQVISSIKRAE